MTRQQKQRAFTLVELMIVVAIVGVLSALAVYGVRRYVANAKTAEARNAIGRMAKDAASAYHREGMEGTIVSLGAAAPISNVLCGDVTDAQRVPASANKIKGQKYQSEPRDWQTGTMVSGWHCLNFSMSDAQYFMYDYDSAGGSTVGTTFTAIAVGDLNGDGNLSRFEIAGKIQKDDEGAPEVTIAPNIVESDPEE